MALRQTTFAAICKARPTPTDAQERIRIWIFSNYFKEYHMSTRVRRTVVLTRAEFDPLYVEPARERWARDRALEPEATATPDASESGSAPMQRARSFLSGVATRASSVVADNCPSLWSDYSCGPRCPGQLRSLPELLSEQPELDEAGSGYAADVSNNEDSSWMSSTTWLDSSSSTQYTPDASSSDFDDASSSDSDDAGSSDSDDAGSSDSDDAGSSDSDDASFSDSDSAANESSEASPVPISTGTTIINQRLAELERAIDHGRQSL